jgi:hypothetical protein
MGVRQWRAGREIDKAKGSKDLEKILRTNTVKKSKLPAKVQKGKERSTMTRKIVEFLKGEKTYITKERYKEMKDAKKKKPTTVKTSAVEDKLRDAGIDEAMIKRLRGK